MVMNIRQIVKDELTRKGHSVWWLAQQVKDHMTAPTVYRFINEDRDIGVRRLEYILQVLDLDIYGDDA